MTARILRLGSSWPRLVATIGFLTAIGAGMLLPVYTDEIGWRFQERAAVDGGVDIMFNDLCGPNTLGHAPWFMMPVRWYSAFANQTFADPLFVRLAGVLCAFAWAMLLWALIAQLESDRRRRLYLQALAFAMLGMGVLPFLLVMSRPEQPIMLATTATILIALVRLPWLQERAAAWVKCGVIVVLLTIAASYHLKGVLYAPITLACLATCASGRRTLLPRGLAIGAVLGVTIVAAHYWVDRFKCVGNDPLLTAHFAQENVAALLSGSHPASGLVLQLIRGLNPFTYVPLAWANDSPMSHWLPDGLFPTVELLTVDIGMLVVWLIAVGFGVRALIRYLGAERMAGLRQPRVLIALAILGCVVVWGASQLRRNDYEAAHVLPMLVLFTMLCFSLPRREATDRAPLPERFVRGTVLFAAAGEMALLVLTLPALLAAARIPGYLDGQPFSVSIGGYPLVRRDISRAIAQSGMPTDRPRNRLLVDDVTYLALQRDTLPLHRLGVLAVWNDGIDDPVAYLRSRGSDGVVVGCRYLPPAMRAVASQAGEVCAISRAGLARLAAADH